MTEQSKSLPRCRPEEVGISSKAISDFIDKINTRNLGVHSFTVVRHGKIAAQCFWKPYDKDTAHIMYSMSKSVTSTAVGFAVSEGLLSVDDKVSKFFPEYKIRSMNKELTVRHLLTMTSDKVVPFTNKKNGTDWVKQFFDAPFLDKPGTVFNYLSENTHMLSAIVTKVTGQPIVDYLYPRIFEPLGIEKPFWEADGKGVNVGGWGLYMKSEDLAKFFLVYLNGGKYESKQILPKEWIDEATSFHVQTPKHGAIDNVCGYGYQFWRNHLKNSYRADGLFGQRCIIMPDYDALVVINSGKAEDYYMMDAFWEVFPKAFSDNPLENDDEAYNEMLEKIENRELSPLPTAPRNFATENGIENKTIRCKTNEFTSVLSISITQMLYKRPGKISSFKFNFKENSLLFTWCEKDEYNTIEASMNGGYGISEIKLCGLKYTAYSQAAWQPDGSLKLSIRPLGTAHVRLFTFFFQANGRVNVINESDPKFSELAVYYMSFIGAPLAKPIIPTSKSAVNIFATPVIEPNFNGKITNK